MIAQTDHAPGEPQNPSLVPVFVRPLDLSQDGAARGAVRLLRAVAAVRAHIATLAVFAEGMETMPGSCIGIIDHPGLKRLPRKTLRAEAEAARAECMRRLAHGMELPEFGNDPGIVPIHRDDWSIRAHGDGWKIEVRGIPSPLGVEGLPYSLLPGDVGGFALSRDGDRVNGRFDVENPRANPAARPASLPPRPSVPPWGILEDWSGFPDAPNST